jgi:hypothetical protein
MPEQPNQGPSIFRLMLTPGQAQQFGNVLDETKERTGISGILCTISRCLDLPDGGLILVLQAARLDRAMTRKIQELIRASNQKHSSAS